jgi:hypothetical protein
MVRYTSAQRVFLYDTYIKFGSARKCRRKFHRKIRDERIPSRQSVHNFLNTLRTRRRLQTRNVNISAEEKLDDIGARLEHKPRKSLKRLAPETGVSKSSVRRTTRLLKLRQYKIIAIHALQQRYPHSRVHF